MRSIVRYRDDALLHLRKPPFKIWLRPKASDLVRLGSEYGGKWIPKSALRPGAVAYCAGAGEDISFDLALIASGLQVTTFDPTPRAISHVESLKDAAKQLRFVPIGWWDEETTLRFYVPANPAHVSHSAMNLQRTSDYFEAPVKPIHQLVCDLGDTHVDLIKMDIEGAENRVIPSMLAHGIRPTVLNVEFDQPQPLARVARTIRQLQRAGYVAIKIAHWDFTFELEQAIDAGLSAGTGR